MNDELTESQNNFLDQIETAWRKAWWRRFYLTARKENAGITVPPDVDGMRALNDTLHRIEQNTADVPWLSRFFANMFKQAGGEVEKKYPSRKK